jgi:DNA-directed RNA polymerase subunit RPC12/RpoP
MSDPVDGNALAGDLRASLHAEMTAATGRCGHCGALSLVGELVVYLDAPSPVARCRHCGSVVFVVHRFREPPQIVWSGFEVGEPPAA